MSKIGYEYTKRDASLKITWKKLHELCKDSGVCKELVQSQGGFMDKMFCRVSGDSPDSPAKPEKGGLYIAAFAPREKIASPATKKYIGWMYNAKDGIYSRFRNVRDYLIGQKNPSGEPWDYKTHPDIIAFESIWEELIPDAESICLEKAIDELLLEIPDINNLQICKRLSPLNASGEYFLTLALLSVIASTLFCFGCGEKTLSKEESERNRDLLNLVLPPLPEEKVESSELQEARKKKECTIEELKELLSVPLDNPDERGEAYYILAKRASALNDKSFSGFLDKAVKNDCEEAKRYKNQMQAVKLLTSARLTFNNPAPSEQNIKKCCENCQKVLQMSPAVNRKCRGEASYILYKYIVANSYRSPSGETAQDYLDESRGCGYALAQKEWMESNTLSITPQYERSSEETSGICYANAENIYSKTFAATIPVSWNAQFKPYDLKYVEEKICDNICCRFLLVDEDERNNLHDFLALLQLIKKCAPKSLEHYEVFIRHTYEGAKPIVDTALSYLPDYTIPVYILDDDKQAAQQLLSCHPLFYPIKSVCFDSSASQTGQERPILNFIVLGSTNVAEWLVREAFWMMSFRKDLIECRIIILAENGMKFDSNIKSRYPGMAAGCLKIDGIGFPAIRGINVDLSSPALSEELADILQSSPYNYFAVAAGTDEENLSFAMKIRESLIRIGISKKNTRELFNSSPVAFLCRDDSLSWISKKMVVEKEEYGDQWFNTWSLIPFGEVSKRYSWDNITGGTFEQLARCIHYQYSQVTQKDVSNNTPEYRKATDEYYARQYNQDSSYSSALSIPYRIFQFRDSERKPIIPAVWNMLRTTTFSSVNQLKALASRLERLGLPYDAMKEEIEEIGEWEHARWVRWMVSRGWLPASIDDAVFAYKNGNKRQQLFVAKLHPCICSYKELGTLHDELLKECGINKEFFKYDRDNIKATRELLELKWLRTDSKEREI